MMIPFIKTPKKYVVIILLILIIIGCRYEFPIGTLLHHGACKNNDGTSLKMKTEDLESSKECVFYEYDGVKNLYFTHTNADFNCCPDEIAAQTVIRGNTILVTENGDGMCDCDCLYDLEFEIRNLEQGDYTLKFDNVEDLVLEIDLNKSYSGFVCAEREGYPWY